MLCAGPPNPTSFALRSACKLHALGQSEQAGNPHESDTTERPFCRPAVTGGAQPSLNSPEWDCRTTDVQRFGPAGNRHS